MHLTAQSASPFVVASLIPQNALPFGLQMIPALCERESIVETCYYIKLRDQNTGDELFKIGICTTSVAERWGRVNGSQFDDSKYSLEYGSKTKKYKTPMEVLLIDSWSFPLSSSGELSKAYIFEQWVKK